MDFLGIDFSGSATKWRQQEKSPVVWIAQLSDEEVPIIRSLQTVQSLLGDGDPFSRLAKLLKAGEFKAASIDAPFSVPAAFIPKEGWRKLVEWNDALPCIERPFPKANDFLKMLPTPMQCKPLRQTEASCGVNVRSTLWWKPRGGAPFTAACLKLISQSGYPPCWPWTMASKGMLVEAFPAAQLKKWAAEYQRYNGPDGSETRNRILHKISGKVRFGDYKETMIQSADALDAVIAAFAGIAVTRGQISSDEVDWPIDEGRISTHN